VSVWADANNLKPKKIWSCTMYALSNISFKEYKEKTDWKHKPVSHVRLAKLLLDIDNILTEYEDSIFSNDIDFSKFEVEFRGCIVDPTIWGQWASYDYNLPFTLFGKSATVLSMKIQLDEIVKEHKIFVDQSVLDESKEGLLFQTVLQEIYILKLEKTFREQSKEYKELEQKNKHVKEFFRSILGGE
jgi:hypothetical protein